MKKHILIALAVLGTLGACKKEETKKTENSGATETPVQKALKVLSSQDWKIEGMFMGPVAGPLMPIPQDDCEKDNYMKFGTDYKQILYFGTEKCDSTEGVSETDVYKLNAAADSIVLGGKEGAMAFAINTLSSSKFEISTTQENFKQKIVLIKK